MVERGVGFAGRWVVGGGGFICCCRWVCREEEKEKEKEKEEEWLGGVDLLRCPHGAEWYGGVWRRFAVHRERRGVIWGAQRRFAGCGFFGLGIRFYIEKQKKSPF